MINESVKIVRPQQLVKEGNCVPYKELIIYDLTWILMKMTKNSCIISWKCEEHADCPCDKIERKFLN